MVGTLARGCLSMGGNYDQWAGRDSIFRNKLSNLRNTGAAPAVPASTRQAVSSEHYLQNLTAENKIAEQPQAKTAVPGGRISIEEAERIALFDSTTDLYNWRFFQRWLAYEMKRGERYRRPLGVLFVTVDGLQTIRASAGSEQADFILKNVVSVVDTVIRDADLAARHDDATVAILLPETNAAGLTTSAERIRQRVRSQPVMYAMQNFAVTVSIGGAGFPFHAKTPDDLIARAKQSVQMAMGRGGDRVCIM